jgi:uncharacterized small protein (DUF1192 family)
VNSHTGEYSQLPMSSQTAAIKDQLKVAKAMLGDEAVVVHGTAEAVEELSRRVKLGASEVERRRARRKQQGESRRRNR